MLHWTTVDMARIALRYSATGQSHEAQVARTLYYRSVLLDLGQQKAGLLTARLKRSQDRAEMCYVITANR